MLTNLIGPLFPLCATRHLLVVLYITLQVHRDHVAMAADGLGIDYTVHWDGILNRYVRIYGRDLARRVR